MYKDDYERPNYADRNSEDVYSKPVRAGKRTYFFDVKMTKEVFAGFFKNAIPVAGGILGGGITYLSFKPCCERLKASLIDTKLSNPNHKECKEESEIFEAIITEANELS